MHGTIIKIWIHDVISLDPKVRRATDRSNKIETSCISMTMKTRLSSVR